ncbi:XRE family transcriptional regulator [Pseudomonas sp. Irchel 3H3]|uniref:XRE family transcriptional regulator n=1 Tax=Pseudomonas sp. Irchel 3H3 TaxID=2009038 RepID=UPI000BA40F04|nr:XRE family transcriptional regulator [Pseudomonas sp. Irchel 3H3]
MDINQTRVKALKAVMAGASQKDFANQHGLDASYLSQILNGHRNLGEKAAANLEDKIGLPKGSLVSPPAPEEQAPITPAASATEQLKLALAKVKGLSDEARNRLLAVADEPQKSNVLAGDFSRPGQVGDEVWIAHYDVRAAMGGGQIPHEYPEMLQDIRVSPKHLREMGVTFKEHFHLKMITGWGQSMAPTIKDRDPLLVDITTREFTGDGIYLFSHDEMLYVKRLQKKGKDRFKMISDNKHHDPEEIRVDDTHILARVLYVWNGNPV